MKELFDLLLLLLWRRAGALGIMVAGIVCAFPVMLLFSWFADPPAPQAEVVAASKKSWAGRLEGFRYDPSRGLIATVGSPTGPADVMFSGTETPLFDRRTPTEALRWLKRNVWQGETVVVYVLESANALYPMRGHLVVGNEWLNGSLVGEGLSRLPKARPVKAYNAGRDALRQLEVEAQTHQRGLWRQYR